MITQLLKEIHQEHLLQFWETLNSKEKESLTTQIQHIDIPTFRQQQKILQTKINKSTSPLEPIHHVDVLGSEINKEKGKKLIAEGKVGCLVVAGGQGTRLKFNGPKGMFPVTLKTKKSLFQLLAEKILHTSKQINRELPIAIMTSPINHNQTVSFFEENHFFGLDPSQINFFPQEMLPLLDDSGNLFLESPSKLAVGPDGNGASIEHFIDSGIWQAWSNQGIRYLNFIQIDNALANPFDEEFVGYHATQNADITVKVIKRDDPHEKVGTLVQQNGKIIVVEYSEMSDKEKTAALPDRSLKHGYANISTFCINMNLLLEIDKTLPFHLAHKSVQSVDQKGDTSTPHQPNAWKFEKFIFDILPHAKKVAILAYPRKLCFAPLKNAHGPDSLATVQQALS